MLGQPRRPGEDDEGDGWTLSRFRAALDLDRAEFARAVADQPEQAPRLAQWLAELEALGDRRERDTHDDVAATGRYYRDLQRLGYARRL